MTLCIFFVDEMITGGGDGYGQRVIERTFLQGQKFEKSWNIFSPTHEMFVEQGYMYNFLSCEVLSYLLDMVVLLLWLAVYLFKNEPLLNTAVIL